MSIQSSIQHGEDAAFVHPAKARRSSNVTLMEQAAERIRRSNGKLLVALILIDRVRKRARSERAHRPAHLQHG